jgi:GDPmannose 4,6-dehydratase
LTPTSNANAPLSKSFRVSTALITGITGQTGSYLCEQLLDAGWRVVGMVRDADDLEPVLHERSPKAELVHGDLADQASLRTVVDSVQPDAIFNLGGISSVAQSWEQPDATARITGGGAASLLGLAWQLQLDTGRPVSFVQASSAEMFGNSIDRPQTEQSRIQPLNPYGAAKAWAHHLVGAYREAGLAASSCILYNHESPRRPEGFVTRKITAGAARIALGLETHISLGNVDAERDWGWAPDYARALSLASTNPGDYIIATGVAHTVRDFVIAAFNAAGIDDWERHIRVDPRFVRPTDAQALVGDASHAKTALGWAPTVDFDQIVRRMVEADLAAFR